MHFFNFHWPRANFLFFFNKGGGHLRNLIFIFLCISKNLLSKKNRGYRGIPNSVSKLSHYSSGSLQPARGVGHNFCLPHVKGDFIHISSLGTQTLIITSGPT